MKKSIKKLSILFIALGFLTSAMAQISTYERQPGYYTLGINGGFAYQDSDIPTILDGYGLGLTLSKNLYYQPGSALSFDIRGRGLYTKTYGMDYLNSTGIEKNQALNGTFDLDYTKEAGGPGYVYHNNQTDHLELGLEGVLNFNELRERTNVILSLYGGVGLDWYNTRIDQSDANGSYAEAYANLDNNSSTSYKKRELKNAILDGRYESFADGFDGGGGKLGIMPSLGVELGYQLTPKFSMGVGHKVTFTKTDQFDGQQWTNNNTLTSDNDIHHYTNLHMRWVLNDQGKKLREPIIKITKPGIDPYTTRDPGTQIKANIKYVDSSMDVDFTVNGRPSSFNFHKEKFNSNIHLEPGRNDIVIFASNTAGSDRETVTIFYQAPVIDTHPQGRRPTVDITNPPHDDFRTDNERFNVRATINNVFDKRDIQFTIDGRSNQNFDYDNRNNTFTANIDLREGRNEIRIEARNDIGSESDAATIILERGHRKAPEVDIYTPVDDPHYTQKRRVVIEAKVYNVDRKDDIRFTINGRRNSDFDFNNETFYTKIDLYDYKTVVVIEGNNDVGTDSDGLTIYLDEEVEQTIDPPVVTITSTSQPTIDPFDPDNCRSTVIATILNIENEHDITLMINGRQSNDFSFNANTQVFQSTVQLEKGFNEVIIKAENEAGNDQDRVSIEGCSNGEQEQNSPVVTITQPGSEVSSTTKPTATIKATVLNIDRKSDIDFVLNGRNTSNFSFNTNSKVLTATINLEEGNNQVIIKAENNDGRDEDEVNIRYTVIDIQPQRPPKVSIKTPADNSTTNKATTELKANVLHVNSKNDIDVYLNGKRVNNFTYSGSHKEVKANLTLVKGNNTIRVTASNRDGNAEDQVNVRYNAPTPNPPVVRFSRPSKPVSNSDKATVGITAIVSNISEKTGITLTINGHSTNDFSYRNGTVTARIKLQSGNNNIVIKATNEDGSDQDRRTIQYSPPVPKPPTVKITKPTSNSTTVSDARANIKAMVTNIDNKNNIIFTFNGKKINDFSLSRNEISANLKLKTGKNSISIKVNNKDGSDQDNRSIIYRLPVANPPAVTISTPRNNSKTEKAKIKVQAIVRNVSQKKGVKLLVNGKSTDFTYNRGELNAEVTLTGSKNTITVKAENKDGKDQASIIVMYTKPSIPKPTVQFTSPSRQGTTVKKGKYTFKAKVTNVSRKEDITVKLNGKTQRGFTYNPRSGEVVASVSLIEGENKLFVEGKNESGKANANSSVKFTKPVISRKNPPRVNIISVSNPTVDPFDPNKAKSTILARLDNISTKRQITFKVNGKKTSSFTFKPESGQFQTTVDLRKGKTTIEIIASNRDGSDEAKRTIEF